MKTITFTCETITPMFLSGADGQTPELRPPSIKGALRFWWRAMNGHLDLKTLKEREAAIFGGTDSGQGRSKVVVRVKELSSKTGIGLLVPHKPFMKQMAFVPKETTFEVTLKLMQEFSYFSLEHLESLFVLVATLGDIGKRSRRGMGSFSITKPEDIQPTTLEEIFIHLKKFSSHFVNDGNKIYSTFSSRLEQYASIRQIQIGEGGTSIKQVLRKISDTTHDFHQKETWKYDASIGTARGGRFASPIYVSVLKSGTCPIITTLNTAPNKNKENVSSLLQENFKDAILE
ncbi:type III-B CRISPR module RAMP protein Cmr1 [Rapidithrix thailandica]|uniref:Type III-B CRISPR module RAMP protein Cmr1 n=1 Tax=Rapidithrix thailandica TaxID=413964 RepID=A0AAW9S3K5_9BACT